MLGHIGGVREACAIQAEGLRQVLIEYRLRGHVHQVRESKSQKCEVRITVKRSIALWEASCQCANVRQIHYSGQLGLYHKQSDAHLLVNMANSSG